MSVDAILKLALENGLFPALFVFAFWYIITEHKEREKSQREQYSLLAEEVKEISETVAGIEESIKRIDTNVSTVAHDVKELRYANSTLEAVIKSRIKE